MSVNETIAMELVRCHTPQEILGLAYEILQRRLRMLPVEQAAIEVRRRLPGVMWEAHRRDRRNRAMCVSIDSVFGEAGAVE